MTTLYAVTGREPDDGWLCGIFDTKEMAESFIKQQASFWHQSLGVVVVEINKPIWNRPPNHSSNEFGPDYGF